MVDARERGHVRCAHDPPECSHDAVIAVILQRVTDDVNPAGVLTSLRQVQVAQTEQRILAAATALFLAEGYPATTLAAVARRAQVGARTVYVRFGTKAALFKRVIDVAIVGDTEPVDALGRAWTRSAFSAPTAAARITAFAAGSRQIMARTGALF